MEVVADLLHDAGLALGEGDVTTRFVLNELDFDLPSLATGLVVIVVVVVGGSGVRGALALDAALLGCGAAIALVVVGRGRVGLVLIGDFTGHVELSLHEVVIGKGLLAS